jgi:ABC-type uncharacterized transport system involved in gliding motility auxiliary subunit
MNRNIASRVLSVLGVVLIGSAILTLFLDRGSLMDTQGLSVAGWGLFVKAVLGMAGVIAGVVLGESGGVKRFLTGRAATFGVFTGISAILVLALLSAANFVAYKNPKSWDLTKNKIFTFSDDTINTLQGLKSDVTVKIFVGSNEPGFGAAETLVRRYADRSPHFKYEFVDPIKNPVQAREYSITSSSERMVVVAGKSTAKAAGISEEGLTNAIVKVLHGGGAKIYYTVGHGEASPEDDKEGGFSSVAKALENEGYQTGTLNLLEKAEVPADAKVVMVIAAGKRFLDKEAAALKTFIDKGGRLAIFDDPQQVNGLEPLMKDWGILVDDNLVVDMSQAAQMVGGPTAPICFPSPTHEATKALARTAVAIPFARSLASVEGGLRSTPLASSGPESWGETDFKGLTAGQNVAFDAGSEKKGPLPIALVAEKPIPPSPERRSVTGRLMVVGSSQFFTNRFETILGNRDFFLNSINWLADQGDRITIRPKSRDGSRIFLTQAQVTGLRFLTMDALPVSLLGLGLAVWLIRRSK